MRRLALVVLAVAVVGSGCSFGSGGSHTYHAEFSRAVQVFENGRVRVLGVDVGTITDIKPTAQGVDVTFTVGDDVKIPADVKAAIVPVSLLGERYVQLYPAYQGGPTLPTGSTIPEDRTIVPAEPDELLRSLEDYLGALDPHTISTFVDNAAQILKGNGQRLNGLLHHGTEVIAELSAKRNDLAQIITEFNKLSTTLSSRQQAIASLIHNYNEVAGTLITNKSSLEGTITGLRDASLQLASLLIAHRDPLHKDVENLTLTGQTLSKNVSRLARTGHWASKLFHAAERAVDYNKKWLRLNNQGQELAALIMMRLKGLLTTFCHDLGLPQCSLPSYWSSHVPSMFCFEAASKCGPGVNANPVTQLTTAISQVPALVNALLQRALAITCTDAKYPDRCLKRKALLIKCAKSSDTAACLKKNAILLKCLKAKYAADVKSCVAAHQSDDVEKIVNDLLKSTLGDSAVSAVSGVGL